MKVLLPNHLIISLGAIQTKKGTPFRGRSFFVVFSHFEYIETETN